MAKLRRRAHRPGARRRRSLAEPLEPRILLSADLPGIHDEPALSPHDDPSDGRHELVLADESSGTTAEQLDVRRELVFVDAGIEGYEQLIDDLNKRDASDSLVEVHVLDQERDGIAQIGEALAAHAGDLDAVHVISHGTQGGIQLGGTWLGSENLASNAASLAGWSSAFADGADLLLYGCDLAASSEGQQLVGEIATLTGADVAASADLTGAAVLGGDWELEYATGSVETAAFGAAGPVPFSGVLSGTAIWVENGSPVPQTSQFDDIAFGTEDVTATVDGAWLVTAGAESPTRNEMIVIGVDVDGKLSGQMWDGAAWTALPFNADLPKVARNDSQGFDVAYDSVSGNAMLVYNNGVGDTKSISYRIWDGMKWSDPGDIALPAAGQVEHIQLAVKPGSQEMVLVAGNDANKTFALVWDGSSWGNAASLHDGTGSQGITHLSVTHEQQGGNAMVVYAKGDDSLYYRQWDGSGWRSEGSISAPSGAIGQPLWTSIASDPTSDKLALGVLTQQNDVWLVTWNGNSWQHHTLATNDSPNNDRPNVAVAFESLSGQAIATYSTSDSRITYRTWTSGNWSSEQYGPDLGERSKAMTLDADPDSDQLMLSVAEHSGAVSFVAWNGTAWSAPNQLESDSGTNKGQPFLFLWQEALVPGRPTADASGGAPYVIREGESVTFDASSSSDPESQPLTYQWDLDGDGIFGEAGEPTGANPTVGWAELRSAGIDDDGTYQIGLRVTDSDGQYDTVPVALTVENTAPTISVSGPSSVSVGASYTLNFAASDPGNETIVGWTINWGDGTIETVGDVTSASHVYIQAGFTRSISVSLEDGDGTWTNSDLLVGNWLGNSDVFHRFDGSSGDFEYTASSSSDLARPYGITVGPDGNYYVSGHNSDNVVRFDSTGSYLGEFIAPGTGGLSQPHGLTWGPDGNLYVANFGGNNILRFDASGGFIDVFGDGSGGMNGPSGIAFAPDGDLYATSWTNNRIMRYDGVNGGSPTTVITSGIASPEQITFDAAGNLYIADAANNAVKMWDGSSLTTYYSDPQLDWTSGLAFGPDGALYVASFDDDLILRYDGSTSEVFVDAASGGLDQPGYLSFTPDLQVYVTGFANTPTVTGATTEMDVQTTSGLVIDRDAADGDEVNWFKISMITNGTLYQNDGTTPINDGDFITYAEANAGLRFTPGPGYVGPASFDVQASTTGDDTELSLATTASITVTGLNAAPTADAAGGAPYVIQNGQSLSLDGSRSSDPEGQPLTYEWDLDNDGVYGEPGEPTDASPLVSSGTLGSFGIGSDGSYVVGLRVTDSGGKSDTTTTAVWMGDTTQTITVTGAPSTVEGDVYTLNLSAQVPGDAARSWTINWGDGTLDTVGDVASATHTYSQPGYTRNITVSVSTEIGTWTNSDLLVGSWQPGIDAVHVFDGTTGDFEYIATSSGGAVQRPSSIVVGPDGNYYVSGHDSNNIVRFDAAGSYLGEFVPSGTPGLINPDGLAFGADGNLYVANAGGNNILRFDASGSFIDVFGSGGDIDKPTGVAFAPDGDLYVASWNNGKVLRLDGGTGGTPTTVIDSGLTEPEELLFDAAGNLYITDGATSSVRIWDGSSLTTHFSDPALVYATGMTFGPDGSLYVASHNNDQIVRFDGVDTSIFVLSGSAGLNQPEYLLFAPELQVHVNHRVEAPVVTGATTSEDLQSTSGLVIDRNAADGLEVSHFKITGITNGTLYHNDGITPINDGDFITWAEGNAGLRFTPAPDYFGPASFDVQASSTGDDSNLSTATTANITVTAVNDAPLLDASGGMMLTDVIEGDSDPAGSSVASIIASAGGDRITDVDPGALEGIAVIGVDNSNGSWEYSTDAGASWSSFTAQGVPTLSTDSTAAVLLADDALVRFVPALGYAGSAGNITFRAWDQSSGTSGDTAVDVSSNGSTTPYSTDIETATSSVVAAVDVAHLVPGAQSTDEDTTLVFSSAGGNAITVHDGSSGDLLLQTTLSVSNGTLTLATTVGLSFDAGADGSASMTISGAESAINAALDGLRFTPTADYSGPADLQMTTRLSDPTLLAYYSFDGASPGLDDGALPANDGALLGGVGSTFDAARGGNVMDFDGSDDSVRIPGLFGEPASLTLAAWVNLDSGLINGEVISLGNNVALRVDHSGGGDFGVIGFFWDGSSFQHTDSNLFVNGTGWRHVAFAFDDANDLQTVYIDGAPIATSAMSQSISYTLGTDTYLGRHGASGTYYLNGKLDDVRVYDRALAGSEVAGLFNDRTSATDSVAITVNPINDAPVLDASGAMMLSDVLDGDTDPPGDTVASIIASAGGDRITDIDPGALEGIAVVGVDDSNGSWEYSTDGGASWSSFTAQGVPSGSTDHTAAVLLADDALVRFVPAIGHTGSAGDITFRAWDQSSGASGSSGVDVSGSDDSSPYSVDVETATLTVVDVVNVTQFLPGAQSTNEDTALVFSSAGGNAISVDDGSGADLALQTTLSVANGTLTLSGTAGLTFASGGDGTTSMTIRGTQSAINAALDGLTFTPTADYSGSANLQVTTRLWDPDLLALYTFDGANPAQDDGALPANDGELRGGVGTAFDAVRGGNVMDFDGSDDSIRISGLFGEPASLTLAAWVNLDSGFFNDSAISLGSNVAVVLDDTGLGNGVTGFFWDGSSFHQTSSNVFINGTGWHHVAFTFDDANDLQTLYIDGAEVGTSASTQSISYTRGSESQLGRRGDFASNFLHGKLDDARIYDHALDGSEIAALFRDQTMATDNIAITVDPVNDAPQGADASVGILEDSSYVFSAADFGFSDPVEGDGFAGVVITTAPGAGTLRDGVTILSDGAAVSAASIAAGNLVFTPAPDANGDAYTSFTFQVRDDGGTLNGGADLDPTPRTMIIDVTPVNDEPVAADESATVAEGDTITLDLASNDTDVDDGLDLASIQIVSGPANGSLAVNADGSVDYTHDGSETSVDSFTYTIRDAAGQVSGAATVSLTVTPVNDVPTATDDTAIVAEGGSVSIDLAANDSDPDDGLDLASIQIVSGPANGSLAVNADGSVDYTHDGSETSADSFTYTIRDAAGQVSGAATVSLTVAPVNDAPTATDDTAIVAEGGSVNIDLAANDSDPDDGLDLASIQIVSGPANGSIAVNADGSVDYTHDGSETSVDSFTYTIRDAAGQVSGVATVDLTITPVNDAPTATDDTAIVAEGGSVNIDLAANDTDVDDGLDPASIQIVSGPANGSIAVNADGSVDYTHDGSETSADSFTYTIRDAAGQVSGAATVSLTVAPVNDAPTATDDTAIVAEGGSVNIDLAANDSDPDDGLDPASIQIVSGPANGSIAVNADGSVDYTHDGSETSVDSFTYTIRDAAGQVSGAATVDLTVTPVNDVPTATDDTAIVAEGGSVNIDLAANDTDVDDGLDPASIQIVSGPANGSLAVNADGSVDYTHDGSETSVDSFTYTIRDAAGQVSGAATVDLTVTPVNDAPTAIDDTAIAAEGGSVNIDLAVNDSDPDDGLDPASIQIVSGPANGSLAVNPDGSVDYTHDGSETSVDSFTYTIRDAAGQVSGAATVDLTVTPVNDAPSGANNRISTTEDTPYTFTTADFGFSDPGEGDALQSVVIATAPTAGTLRDGATILTGGDTVSAASIAAGDLVFTPAPNATGPGHASFDFQVRDDGGTVNGGVDLDATPNTITIDVTTLNDAPVLVQAAPSLGSITEDQVGNSGETVATILGSSVSDADAGATEGIAITRLSSGNGSWQYSSDGGASWTSIGPVGSTSALLLRDTDRIRFVPDGENADSASFDFRAWDRSSGVFATKADATATGGSYAFSSASDTAAITVSAVNDAPGLQSASLASVPGDSTNAPGESVGSLFAGRFSDVDDGALMSGIAVVGNGASSGTQGSWQYSSDAGTTWFVIGAVGDDSTALALDSNTRLRFAPAAGFDGTPQQLVVRALDDTYRGAFSSTASGSETRANVDTGSSGGSSSISATTASVSTQILTIDELPTIDSDTSPEPSVDAPEPSDDPGTQPDEPPDDPATDPSSDTIPLGALPEAEEHSQSVGPRGSSSQPFSDASVEATHRVVESEATPTRGLRSHDTRAQKAETRADVEARDEGLGFVHNASELARELDRLRREVEVESVVEQRLFGSSIALTAGLSIGYIVWLTRGGLLIASLVSSMPVWRLIDPVPILAGLGSDEEEDGEQSESLDSMLEAEPPGAGAGSPPSGAEDEAPPPQDETARRGGS